MAQTVEKRRVTYRDKKKYEVDERGKGLAQLNLYITKAHRALLSQLAKRRSITTGQLLAKIIFIRRSNRKVRDLIRGLYIVRSCGLYGHL